MRIILLHDVRGFGKKNEVKDAKDGYARNFLFPKKLAEPASPDAVRRLETLKKEEGGYLKRLESLATRLKDRSLIFELKTDAHGSVFGSVNKEMILSGLRDAKLITKERVGVALDRPIKTLGEHEIMLDLSHNIKATIKIIVRPQP
ncbi:MAG: 50S ribosomal protein L9 [Patescibacteria group bacterium]